MIAKLLSIKNCTLAICQLVLLLIFSSCTRHGSPPSREVIVAKLPDSGIQKAVEKNSPRETTEPTAQSQGKVKGITALVGNGIIVPGKSIGKLYLGDSPDLAKSYLGIPTEELGSGQSGLYWNDNELDRRGVEVFFDKGLATQIESFTTRFETSDGVKPDDLPSKLRHSFPKLQAFKLLGSGSEIDGGEDIIYWVEKEKGIAFGIYYYPRKAEKRIGSIIIFQPDTEFLPGFKILPPRRFIKIPDWSVD